MGIVDRIRNFFNPKPTTQESIREQVKRDMEDNKVLDRLAAAKAAHPAGKGRKTYVPMPTERRHTPSNPSKLPRRSDRISDDYVGGADPDVIAIQSWDAYENNTPSYSDDKPASTYTPPAYESPSYTTPSWSDSSSSSSSSSDSGGFSGGGSD